VTSSEPHVDNDQRRLLARPIFVSCIRPRPSDIEVNSGITA